MADSETDFAMPGGGRIKLYKREHLDNQNWYARIKVPNATGYKVLSTKTEDIQSARQRATESYNALCLQVMAGGKLTTKTFKQVFEQWKSYEANGGTTQKGGSWDSTIKRIESYALPHFGPMKIDQIGEAEFTEYWIWRRTNFNKKRPSVDTLRRERTCILPVFRFALSKGYITHIPQTNAPKVEGRRRATFTPDEWEAIKKVADKWVREGARKATHRDRLVARNFIFVLAETGMRVGELRELRWGDLREIRKQDQPGKAVSYQSCIVEGKTKEREVVFQPQARVAIGAMKMLRLAELKSNDPDYSKDEPPNDQHIFCHPDGTPIKEYKHSFLSLLEFAGIPVTVKQGTRSLYSFRHFYATQRLSAEVSPFLLARNMGTSIEMLEKHYGQVITSTVARQITGTEPFSLKFGGS